MKKMWMSSIVVLCLVLVLAACGGGNNAPSNSQGNEGNNAANNSGNNANVGEVDSSPINTTIMGGRVGGAWSVFTEGVAESIRRTYDGSIITVEPGGIVENAPAVGSGQIPYGLAYAMTAFQAYSGTEPYTDKFEDLRSVSVIISENAYQLVARAGAEFNTLEEIAEKQLPVRLVVDQRGAPGEIITRNILEAVGISYDDIISWGGSVDHLGGSKAFELMQDGRADLTGDAVPVPDGDILEAAATMDLKLISFSDTTIQTVSENLGLISQTIPAGTYDFQAEEVKTVNTPSIVIVNSSVAEDEVYKVTKAIYNNLEYLGTVHNDMKKLTQENLHNVGSLPLHPGAEKFYKEVGLIQ